MYFESILLKDKKPNGGFFRNKVVLFNSKTKQMQTVTPGLATDWEYFIEKGFTHWLKSISKNKLREQIKEEMCICGRKTSKECLERCIPISTAKNK